MSRIRSIHPGIFTDESFVAVSMTARVLVPGLWVEADDNGIFEWKPLTLKMKVFPADNVDLDALLAELLNADIIKRFTVDGKDYGAVRNFGRYQRPKKPSYKHPLPPELRTYVHSKDDSSPPVPNQFPTSTEKSFQREEEGGRRKEKKDAAPSGAHPMKDDEADLFRRGKEVLGNNSGGLIASLRKSKGGSIELTRAAIEMAATKQDPREYIGRVISGPRSPPKVLSPFGTEYPDGII
jgi:hypothetical protein